MNKELDVFLLQVAQSVFRYGIHKDIQQLFDDVNALYVDIQHIKNPENIYIGPLHTQNTYVYSVSSSFLDIADAIMRHKNVIYKNPAYVMGNISESFRFINNRDSIVILLCLGFLFGGKVFAHKGLIYRLQNLDKTEFLQITDYHDPIFSNATLHIADYAMPMFRQIFELLNLIPKTDHDTYHRSYGVADMFIRVHGDVGLPTKIPIDLAWYPSVKKAYLRHIMHYPEDTRYLNMFKVILENSDRITQRGLHYFSHTIGGAYTPAKGAYQTQLCKWYDKEIDEKQLDEVFDDVIKDERKVFEELGHLGVGISLEANLRLTKKRFSRIQKLVESHFISEYKELAGPFLIKDSSMLSIKILRRQIND